MPRHSFFSQLRHFCNSIALSFPSGSRKILLELQQVAPKAVDSAPATPASAPVSAQSMSASTPQKPKALLIGSHLPVPSSTLTVSSSQLLSPATPSHPSSFARHVQPAAGNAAESSSSFELGMGGTSDFEGAGPSSAAGISGGTITYPADFFVSARQGEKLVRIFARESERLSMVPPPTRTAELRRSLQALSQRIPSNLYIPIFPRLYSRWRLVGIAVEQYASTLASFGIVLACQYVPVLQVLQLCNQHACSNSRRASHTKLQHANSLRLCSAVSLRRCSRWKASYRRCLNRCPAVRPPCLALQPILCSKCYPFNRHAGRRFVSRLLGCSVPHHLPRAVGRLLLPVHGFCCSVRPFNSRLQSAARHHQGRR